MAAVALTAALVVFPAHPHTADRLAAWSSDWTGRAVDGMSVELMDEWRDVRGRHRWFFNAQNYVSAKPPLLDSSLAGGVEQWRSLVASFFPGDQVDLALRVIGCESGGNPSATNPSSGAAGLFQHLPRYWVDRSAQAGWTGADIYDPTANVAVAAWLALTDGWQHWNPSRGCW